MIASKVSLKLRSFYSLWGISFLIISVLTFISGQVNEDEYEPIDDETCIDCHEIGIHETVIVDDLSRSSHEDRPASGGDSVRSRFFRYHQDGSVRHVRGDGHAGAVLP